MFGADPDRLAQPQSIAFEDAGIARAAFGLVGEQHHRDLLLAQPLADFRIQRGDPGTRIDHEQRGIGAFE